MIVYSFRKHIRDYVRRTILKAVLGTLETEPDPHGFVLVVWDSKGVCTVSYDVKHGPVHRRMVAEHVKTALQGQAIIDDAIYQMDDRKR